MDAIDNFYQHLDSEELLNEHGTRLAADAREILQQAPAARVAGMILQPDSPEAEPFRRALARATGQPVPAGLLVGVAPRQMVERLLTTMVGTAHWQEEAGEPQGVLPVVVSTRDGFRFGFFGLSAGATT